MVSLSTESKGEVAVDRREGAGRYKIMQALIRGQGKESEFEFQCNGRSL